MSPLQVLLVFYLLRSLNGGLPSDKNVAMGLSPRLVVGSSGFTTLSFDKDSSTLLLSLLDLTPLRSFPHPLTPHQ